MRRNELMIVFSLFFSQFNQFDGDKYYFPCRVWFVKFNVLPYNVYRRPLYGFGSFNL